MSAQANVVPMNGKQRREAKRAAREASAQAAVNRIAPSPVTGGESSEGVLAAPPKPPRKRKAKAPKDCACGCGAQTKGGRFLPGHDSKLLAWVGAVERGQITLAQIPSGQREAVERHMSAAK